MLKNSIALQNLTKCTGASVSQSSYCTSLRCQESRRRDSARSVKERGIAPPTPSVPSLSRIQACALAGQPIDARGDSTETWTHARASIARASQACCAPKTTSAAPSRNAPPTLPRQARPSRLLLHRRRGSLRSRPIATPCCWFFCCGCCLDFTLISFEQETFQTNQTRVWISYVNSNRMFILCCCRESCLM